MFRLSSKGVLLVAVGSPIYGEMAVTLTLSIKLNDPTVKVSLAGNGQAIATIPPAQKLLFDNIIVIPEKDYIVKKQPHYGLIKTKLPYYTPYDSTIFLDVDTILFRRKRLSLLFNELAGQAFTCQTFPFFVLGKGINKQAYVIFWAPVKSVRQAFKIDGQLAQVHSYFLYFDKEKAKPLFDKANEVYFQILNNEVEIKHLLKWRKQIPDELCFSIATGLTKIFPHQGKFDPLAEPTFVNSLPYPQLEKGYFGFTMPGNGTETYLLRCKKLYDKLKTFYFARGGMKPRFSGIVK